MNKPEKPSENVAPFNMGLIFIFRINELVEQKNNASIENDLMKWYFVMREIYTDNIFFFDTEEKSKFMDLFKKARQVIWTKNNDLKTLKLNFELNAPLIREKLESVWIELNMKLYKCGLIFPKIDTTPMMEKLRGKYKIGI